MNSLPSFVKWADEDIIAKAKAEMLPRMEEWTNPDVDFTNGWTFDEIRNLATVVSEIGYDEKLYKKLPYEQRNSLEKKLCDVFDVMLKELLPIYNLLDEKLNREKWSGDQRYKLLALHNRKGYTEMSVLKNAVWFAQLEGKVIDIESAKELNSIMSSTLYWEFGNEYKGYDWEESPAKFKKANECRKREIQAQNDFVYHVLVGNIQDAYNMIKNQIARGF